MTSQEIMNKVKTVEKFAESIGLPADIVFWDVDREAAVDDIEQAVNDCYCYDGRSPVAMRLTPRLIFFHDIYVKAEPEGDDWCDKYELVDPKERTGQ